MLEALGLYDRAINSASAKFGPAHVKIAPLLHWKALTLTRLATMLSTQRGQKLQEAVTLYDLAVDIFTRDKGPTDEKALISTLSKARALRLMGDAESANRGIQLLDTVIKVKASALGDAHVEVVTLLVEKAGALTLVAVPQLQQVHANLTEAVALCDKAIAALDSARQPAPFRNLLMSALGLKAHALLRLPSSQRAALEVYDRMIDTVGAGESTLLPLLRTKLELLERVGELAAAAQLCDRVIHIANSNSQPVIVISYTNRRTALTKSLADAVALPAIVSS
jgi:tetratricopeptide (TPR) repeat protein